MSETEQLVTPIAFPPAVLARISPELSLQRHLAIGIRPNLRKFEEFRPIHITDGGLSRYSNEEIKESLILGSSVLKSGNTTIITTINASLIEEDLPAENINEDAAAVNAVFAQQKKLEEESTHGSLKDAASIYPNVEVERGRTGPPTDEEMILSQKLYHTFLHSGILSKQALKVNVGLRSINEKGETEFYYHDPNDEDSMEVTPKRSWSFVLYANVKVFNRSGPLFDLVWASLLSALKSTNLPQTYIDENAIDIRIPVKLHNNAGTIREQYSITCDPVNSYHLKLNQEAIGFSSNFGVVDIDEESFETVDTEDKMDIDSQTVLLTEIEGEEEETTIKKTINIIVDQSSDNLKSLTLIGGIDRDELRKSIQLAKIRSNELIKLIK
jgi:exosome complex component RRP43